MVRDCKIAIVPLPPVQTLVTSICNYMEMPGCEKCVLENGSMSYEIETSFD
jgi:hypothetical protein